MRRKQVGDGKARLQQAQPEQWRRQVEACLKEEGEERTREHECGSPGETHVVSPKSL
jgi:hypothetical protein